MDTTDREMLSGDLNVSVFRAFDRKEFLEWPAWWRLRRILESNGGSYGLSGPRGSGKTWLMLRAIDDVQTSDASGRGPGIALWYPSPSEYDPLAFLASLSDSLANEIERRFRRENPVLGAFTSNWLLALSLPVVTGLLVFAVLARLWDPQGWGILLPVAIGVATALVAGLLTRTPLAFRALRPEARLLREAALVRERARYSATRREALELGAEGGRGLVGKVRRSRERELIERPATLSSLVNDFRALAAQAGDVAGRVVIAIDELDKMSDPDKVRELLRDIKAIFEVPHVHFLVSVSDEAARSLNLGALAGRDEFNSSFYTVIELPPATPEASADLLFQRAQVPRDKAISLAVLAGGNPREVLRLAELVSLSTEGGDAVVETLRQETLNLRREIVTAAAEDGLPEVGQEARIGAFTNLPDDAFANPGALSALADSALGDEMWQPPWRDAGFAVRFDEPWRRLMVRLAVAGRLIQSPSIVRDPDLGVLLQDVVLAASQSAHVARIVLDEHLRVEARGPSVDKAEARSTMAELAREYETIRSEQPFSEKRTAALDEIVRRARTLARYAEYSAEEIETLLASDNDGDRVTGLAAVQATGDPGALDSILDAVADLRSPFEQYHALVALESLRPSLSGDELDRVVDVVTQAEESFGKDKARTALAQRLVEAIGKPFGEAGGTGDVIGVSDLAQRFGIHPNHLRRLVRDHGLVPNHEPGTRYRLDQAAVLRISRHPAVREAAGKVRR